MNTVIVSFPVFKKQHHSSHQNKKNPVKKNPLFLESTDFTDYTDENHHKKSC